MVSSIHFSSRLSWVHSFSQKILEEQELRQDLQVKLLQSEQQLRQLKQSLGNAMVSNGPASDFSDGASSEFSPSKSLALIQSSCN